MGGREEGGVLVSPQHSPEKKSRAIHSPEPPVASCHPVRLHLRHCYRGNLNILRRGDS
ncbi:hypothetical protein EYF80_012486 [Liparis tanakae]|uniref:Uncharacterized protein n=1 Tax=Liparis tanakae TaxID=230148 RepID=A0A4Z2IJE7_9TELE|nr:hypothetical protein EYF80_012486 [Liparis tanakae]